MYRRSILLLDTVVLPCARVFVVVLSGGGECGNTHGCSSNTGLVVLVEYFLNMYPVVPIFFRMPIAPSPVRQALVGLCSKYPATALASFLVTSRRLPADTFEGS